jgi:chromosomal replication initiation ATPase DnaA
MKTTIITPYVVTMVASSITNKPAEEIRSETRKASVVAIRDICFKICKDHLFMVQHDIAEYFGRNRSSIAHALNRVDRNLDKRPQYRKLYNAIIEKLDL